MSACPTCGRSTAESDTLSLTEVADRLRVNRTTIWRIAKRGDEIVPGVRAFRIGSQLRVSRIQLDRFLETGRAEVD